jgi:hypothetical protein
MVMKLDAKKVGRIVLLGALLAPLAAAAQGGRGFGGGDRPGCGRTGQDPSAVTSVQGEVVDVERIDGRRHQGVHLTLDTGSERLEVALGPDFYVDAQALKVAKGDRIEVTGARTSIGGQPAIVAQEVRRGGEVLALRDASGVPLWRGRGMGRP